MGPAARRHYKQEKIPEEKLQTRERKTKKGTSKLFLKLRPFIVLGIVAYILFSFGGLQMKMHQVNAQITALEEEKNLLLGEQEKLLKEKEKINDPIYIERRAREALGFIKSGEKILLPAEAGEAMPLKMDGIEDIRD